MTNLEWRMTCSTKAGAAHRKLYRLPEGATLENGLAWWIVLNGETVRCSEDGCTRAMRGIAITDSHRGLGERKECGEKCIAAIGPACDCKCKGANHGAN